MAIWLFGRGRRISGLLSIFLIFELVFWSPAFFTLSGDDQTECVYRLDAVCVCMRQTGCVLCVQRGRGGRVRRMTKRYRMAYLVSDVWCVYLLWFLALSTWTIAPLKRVQCKRPCIRFNANNRTQLSVAGKSWCAWRSWQVQTRDKQHWNFSINTGIFRRGGRAIRKIPFATPHRPCTRLCVHQFTKRRLSLTWMVFQPF